MLCQGLVFTFVYKGWLKKKGKKSPFAPGKHIIVSKKLQFSTQAVNFLNKYLIYFGKHQHLNGNPSTSIKSAATQGLFFFNVPSWTYPTFFSIFALLLLVITSTSSENQAYSTDDSLCSLKRKESLWSAQYPASSWANCLVCTLSPAARRHLRTGMLMKTAWLSADLEVRILQTGKIRIWEGIRLMSPNASVPAFLNLVLPFMLWEACKILRSFLVTNTHEYQKIGIRPLLP